MMKAGIVAGASLVLFVASGCCGPGDRYDDGPDPRPTTPGKTQGDNELVELASEATVGITSDGTKAYVTTRATDGTGSVIVVTGDAPRTTSPLRLATSEKEPYAIANDTTHVFWTSRGTGTVRAVKKTGGLAFTVAAKPENTSGADGIALDSTHVYWTSTRGVYRTVKAGGDAMLVAEDAEGASAIVADTTHVYWLARGTTAQKTGAIKKAPKAGGTITVLATGELFGDIATFGLAADTTSLYFAHKAGGRIFKLNKVTGDVDTIAENQISPDAVTTDGTFVFWTTQPGAGDDRSTRAVWKVRNTGGSVTKLADAQQGGVYAVAAGSRHVFWTNYVSTGSVYGVAK